MNSQDSTVLLHTFMPDEVAFAALYSILNSKARVIQCEIKQAQDLEFVRSQIRGASEVLMIGAYWTCLSDLLEENKMWGVKFYVQVPGKLLPYDNSNLQQYQVPISTFVINQARKHADNLRTFDALVRRHKSTINLLDDRAKKERLQESQILFDGLKLKARRGITLFEMFQSLFTDEYDIDEIMEIGQHASEAKYQIAYERALNNSIYITTKKGDKALLTEAPELVDISHEELNKMDPSIKITIVFNHKLRHKAKTFSFRSYSEDVDAESYAISLGGGGSKKSAGATVICEEEWPF